MSSSTPALHIKDLTFDEHCTISAIVHATKDNFVTKKKRPPVSAGVLLAGMRSRLINDPHISHIPPTFKTDSELQKVLAKFVKAGWVVHDARKSTYAVNGVNWDRAKTASVSSESSVDVARHLLVEGLIKLHSMANDQESFKLCHSFHKIFYVVPLSAACVAKTLYDMEGYEIDMPGKTLRVHRIRPRNPSNAVIASQDSFWGLEPVENPTLRRVFDARVDVYAQDEIRARIERRKYNIKTHGQDTEKSLPIIDFAPTVPGEERCNLFPFPHLGELFIYRPDPNNRKKEGYDYIMEVVEERIQQIRCRSN
jgi:hypothetical protein